MPLLEKREKGRTPSYFSVSVPEIGAGKLTGQRSRPPALRSVPTLVYYYAAGVSHFGGVRHGELHDYFTS